MPEAAAGERLDRFLASELPVHSRTALAEWVKAGRVTVDGAIARPSLALKPGWSVVIDAPEPLPSTLVPEKMTLEVLYADEALVVVDKPAGLVVHPGAGHDVGTLVHGLLELYGTLSPVGLPERPGIVHRLDRGTSGIIVIARTEAAHHHLARQFSRHTVDRRYRAVVWDHGLAAAGTARTLYGRHPTDRRRFTAQVTAGKPAVTHWQVLSRLPPCAFLECRLETGRTHQIRVHLSEAGAPLVGDATYGRHRRAERPDALRLRGPELGLERQALHAFRLGFEHPVTGEHLLFESALPPELVEVLDLLAEVNGLGEPRPW